MLRLATAIHTLASKLFAVPDASAANFGPLAAPLNAVVSEAGRVAVVGIDHSLSNGAPMTT